MPSKLFAEQAAGDIGFDDRVRALARDYLSQLSLNSYHRVELAELRGAKAAAAARCDVAALMMAALLPNSALRLQYELGEDSFASTLKACAAVALRAADELIAQTGAA